MGRRAKCPSCGDHSEDRKETEEMVAILKADGSAGEYLEEFIRCNCGDEFFSDAQRKRNHRRAEEARHG